MSNKTIKVKVFRFDPAIDKNPYYKTYEVPFEEGMSAMGALDYIYQNQDGALSYYDHAGCSLGICGRCTGRINGRPGLFCQTRVEGDVLLEPMNPEKVLKDLVIKKEPVVQSKKVALETGGTVMQDINSVPLIIRREIEALIAVPLIKAFMSQFGREPVFKITGQVIRALARQTGELLKTLAGGNSMEHFLKALPMFSQGDALEFELIEATPAKVAVNITRCKYAEMYQDAGLREFGFLLACGRDYALTEGFNPKIKFNRTQTIMEGAPFCDFCFSMEEDFI